MATVKIIFKKKVVFALYSLEVNIDNQTTVHVANGSSTDIELSEGMHTITASIPIQGNKMAMTNVQFEVKPGMSYEVTYAAQAASINAMSMMEAKEISTGIYGDKGTVIAKSKGRRNGIMIFSMVFSAAMLIFIIWMFTLSGVFGFLGIEGKNIDYVNEPFTITTSRSTTTIESIRITSVENSTIKSWVIGFEIIGVVEGANALSMEVKCYDKDDFFIGTLSLRGSPSVADGERFKVQSSIWAPWETTRIEFVTD